MGAFRQSGRGVVTVLAAELAVVAVLAVLASTTACDTAAPGFSATGGQAGTGGTAGTGGGGGHGGTGTGGAVGADAATAPDACDDGDLWDVISEYEMTKVRLGYCLPGASGTAAVVFDADGGIADITGTPSPQGPTKAAWLQTLAGRRWPCRAGQTVHYSCVAD